jgi:hypothetical protein
VPQCVGGNPLKLRALARGSESLFDVFDARPVVMDDIAQIAATRRAARPRCGGIEDNVEAVLGLRGHAPLTLTERQQLRQKDREAWNPPA